MSEKKTQDALLEAIDIMIENKLKKLKFNYYVDGVIDAVNNDKTYNVIINGTLYTNISSKNNFKYSKGDSVQILIKNGDWNKKFIDDKITHNMDKQTDYVVEQGQKAVTATQTDKSHQTTVTWDYTKWASGKAECECRYKITFDTIAKTWGDMYYEVVNDRIPYPFTFTKIPYEFGQVFADRYGIITSRQSGGVGVNTTTHSAVYVGARPAVTTESTAITLDLRVVGKWK